MTYIVLWHGKKSNIDNVGWVFFLIVGPVQSSGGSPGGQSLDSLDGSSLILENLKDKNSLPILTFVIFPLVIALKSNKIIYEF